MIALALLLQAVPTAPPERFSILAPVAEQPCVRRDPRDDVLVCADPLPAQAVPLPTKAIPPDPQPVNRDMTGTGALAAQRTPCAARVGGCQVGVDVFGAGTAVIRGIQKLVAPDSCCEEPGEATSPALLARDAVRAIKGRRRDTRERVAIRLDDDAAGRLLP